MEELLAHGGWLRSLAAKLVRDEARADDLVQEAWLAVLERPGPSPRHLRRWLGGVLRNKSRLEQRGEERRRARERRAATTEVAAPSAADLVEAAERQRLLAGAVLELEEPFRSTLLQRYFGGLSSRTIARREGVPEATVRSRLKRALDRLRAELDDRHGGDRRAWCLSLLSLARTAPTSLPAGAFVALSAASLLVATLGVWWFTRPAEDRSVVTSSIDAPTTLEDAVVEGDSAVPPPTELPGPIASPSASSTRTERVPVESSPASVEARGDFELLVIGRASEPVGGAEVRWWPGPLAEGTAFDDLPSVLTDAAGVAWVTRGDSEVLTLRIRAEGFIPFERRIVAQQTVRLIPAGELHGRVLCVETEQPVAGATIGAPGYGATARSDARGRYQLAPVPVGTGFMLEGSAPSLPYQWQELSVASMAPTSHDIWLTRGTELRGRVFDVVTGKPVSDAAILQEMTQELCRSGPDGTFDTRVVLHAEYGLADILVVAPGYCSLRLDFKGGSEEGLEMPLVRWATVEGEARDPEGQPVADAPVWVRGSSGYYFREVDDRFEADSPFRALPVEWRLDGGRDCLATTDRHGRFRIEGVLPWVDDAELWIEDPGGDRHFVPVPSLEPDERVQLEITTRPMTDPTTVGRITGVFCINGEPQRGWMKWTSGEDRTREKTDPDGNFEIEDVPVGEVRLSADPGYFDAFWSEEAKRVEQVVRVTAGETVHVDFDVAVPASTIRGHVHLPTGEPARQHEVWSRCQTTSSRYHAETDQDGVYTMLVPAAGGPFLVASSYGPDGTMHRNVPAGSEGIDFLFEPYGRVRLRARDPSTSREFTVFWWVRRLGSTEPWTEVRLEQDGATDAEGYVACELTVGRWEFLVGSPVLHYPYTLSPVVGVDEGQTTSVEVALEPGVALELRLAASETPLPPQCTLFLEATAIECPSEVWDLEPWFRRPLSFDERGRARLQGLAPGSYRLVASREDVVCEPGTVEVTRPPVGRVTVGWSYRGR